jgi:cytochrome c oxidase subunit 2
MAILATAVFVAVVLALVATMRRRSADPEHDYMDTAATRNRRWLTGLVTVSAVILTIVFVASERVMHAVHGAPETGDLRVTVKAWQWWWEVAYVLSGDTVISANEIHLPVGRRIRLELTSGDVIHSLWVPNLQGKTDLMPGDTNVMWLQADRAGVSHAPCAEYCGVQHAHMTLIVVSHTSEDFERWLAQERLGATEPTDSLRREGAVVFARAGCAYCHLVRGTNSLGKLGPDLTHFGARRTIAAATLENSALHLTAWLADPQRVKPGTRMPTTALDARQLAAVVAYVGGLR